MNVVPFRTRQGPAPLAFTLGARIDLRVGVLTAGVVRPREEPGAACAFATLSRLLRSARMAWLERGAEAPLVLALPEAGAPGAEELSDAAVEAGATRRTLRFELDERHLLAAGSALAEDLRARGWGLVLRGDPACPLPFGGRARALYSELVLDAPAAVDPFLAMDCCDRSPLGRRLIAAKAAGMMVTAEGVASAHHAQALAIAGFDRCGGLYAESGIR